jgi:uncharacterized membrane protein (UPF0127 family)
MVTQAMQLAAATLEAEVRITPEDINKGVDGSELQGDIGIVVVSPQETRFVIDSREIKAPIDAGFFNVHGKLDQVIQMQPDNEGPYASGSDEVQFLLQMRSGWFSDNNIQKGDRLDFIVKTPIWMCYDMMRLLPSENFEPEPDKT